MEGIARVNLALTEDQQFVRQTFSALFSKEADPARVRAAEPLGHDPHLWTHLIATGALGVGILEALGGGGGGLLELALIAEEAGRRVAPIPLAEPAAAARLLAACDSRTLLDDALGGSRIISLATRPGPLERQVLTEGAIADVVLVLQGDRLVGVQRPADVRPTSNMGAMPLARWTNAGEVGVLAEGDQARELFSAALNEVRVLRAATLVGLASEAIEIGRRTPVSGRRSASGSAPTRQSPTLWRTRWSPRTALSS